ncbi:hypothetical protein IT412_02345, partial [Candidatus Peregrinibacteria bacterium]|nr:hypothetical protein [Candidatus Peregrinibacteria bacterium]
MKQSLSTENLYLDPNAPSAETLAAFNLEGIPVLLAGGGGQTYRINNAVLKPAGNEVLMSWLAEITENLTSEKFRLPKPLRTKNGDWTFQGWIGHQFLDGHHEDPGFIKSIEVCQDFHQAMNKIEKPNFYNQLDDPFHQADKMVWGEIPLPDYDLTNEPLKILFSRFKKIDAPDQLIHGDWGFGNMLFHEHLPPAIIDITPYFRPANLPIAGMLIHAIIEGADISSTLQLGKHIKDFDQLVLRALAK